jgi:hypothetical protein
MGISAGGGGVWDYASASVANSDKIAAIIPFCGTTNPTTTMAGRIAASKLPVWAFHNTHDGTVPVAYSRNWVSYINSYVPTPSPAAKLTEFPVQSNDAVIAHECWSLATLPSYKPEGINIYEWLLQYKRRSTTANAVPVARAGNDATVVLPATVSLNGSASSDADGMIAAYRWRKLSGPASWSFSDSTAANTIVSNLAAGSYQFELRVTDNGGATATDNISVIVYAASAPGSTQRVLIDIGAGPLTTSPFNGLYWNNLTDGRPGIRISNAITTSNAPSGINVEVINRLDGSYSVSSSGLGTGNTTGTVNDYPASATTDYQLIHSSGNNGLWRITGMNASNTYTIKFWGSMSGPSPQRTAEIKRADETTWKSYTATSNTNYNNAAVFIISGKTTMDFNIRTQSGSDYSALCVLDISYGGENEESDPESPNNPPVANAGPDAGITMPTNNITLNGAGSTDADGSISSFSWKQLSGATATIASPSSVQTAVTFPASGIYSFELTVVDNRGGSAKDLVDVTVSPSSGAVTKTLRVNVFGGTNPYNSPQWNNWNLAGSLTSARFNYDDGTGSNINATITSSALIADNGATYATNATACPPPVLRYASANTSYRTLTLSGLTSSGTYTLEFYASRANTGNSTRFQIGNQSYTIATDNNVNTIARFTNIAPDNTGRISIIIDRVGTWNYLSGFVITENTDNSLVMESSRTVEDPVVIVEKPVTESAVPAEKPTTALAAITDKPGTEAGTLALYPNPATDIIYLDIPAGVSGSYKLSVLNMSGRTVLQKTGTKRNTGYADKLTIRNLPKGMYLLKFWLVVFFLSSTILKL